MSFVRRHADGLLAFGVGLAGTLQVLFAAPGDVAPGEEWAAWLTVVALAVPMVWRRRFPGPVLLGTAALGAVLSHTTVSLTGISGPIFALCAAAYALGRLRGGREAVAYFVPTVLCCFVISLAAPEIVVGDFIFPTFLIGAPLVAGRTLRARAQLSAELHERAVRLEEEADERVRQATADERRRIAREMHDIVAHSVSVMVVQAAGARRILDRDPERAEQAAALIESTGRTALAEMRSLLGALKPEGSSPELLPQPGLDRLDDLVERARHAGLPVEVRRTGEPRTLPAGVDLAAYRVLQEALTNALRHGSGAATEVEVAYAPAAVDLRVRNALRNGAASAPPGGGNGLVGMRERVALYGGELEAGPEPGGFVVRARIPTEVPA